MRCYAMAVAAVVVAGLLSEPATLEAQTVSDGPAGAYDGGAPGSPGLPELARTLTLDQMRVASAQQQLEQAEAAVPSLVWLRKQYESSPGFQAALTRLHQAQMASDATRRAVLAKIKNNPEYRAAIRQRDEVDAQLDFVRKVASQDTIYYLATKKLAYAKEASRIEVAAMAADPQIRQRLDQVVAAGRSLRGVKDHFEQTLMDDPSLLAAEAEVQKAHAAYDSAMKDFVLTQAAYDQAIEDRDVTSRRGYGSYGNTWWPWTGWSSFPVHRGGKLPHPHGNHGRGNQGGR